MCNKHPRHILGVHGLVNLTVKISYSSSVCFCRWKEVTQWVTDKLSLNHSLAFSYFDEEGDLIFVSVHIIKMLIIK